LENRNADLLKEARKLADKLGITLTEIMLSPGILDIINKIIKEKRNKS
jgi:uncharacterized protein with GYD domain